MTAPPMYLRPDVAVEPLIDQWYAWFHLIPPATAALNISGSHLKIMEGYVKAPKVHMAAVKNPALRGGPFIDYPEDRSRDIDALLTRTRETRAPLLELADALRGLQALLEREGTGASLEPLYAQIPPPLRGCVELTYDLGNHPSYRLIEPLMYGGPYHDSATQGLMVSRVADDFRPFVMSTPRLGGPDETYVEIPFADPSVDRFFRLDRQPLTLGEVRDLLPGGLDDEAAARFLTATPPRPRDTYAGDGVRCRYFGHACVLVESGGTSVFVDPVMSYDYPAGSKRYTVMDLPEVIDYIVITHAHTDHIVLESLLRLRHKTRHIVVPRNDGGSLADPSLRLALEAIGFDNVIDLPELGEITFPGGRIVGLPFFGEHGDLGIRSKLAYAVQTGGRTLVFAADSRNMDTDLYRHVRRQIGPVDVLYLGMECDGAPMSWLYGPLLPRPLERKFDQSRRLAGSDYECARGLVDALECGKVFVYAMGQEEWLNHIMATRYTPESRPIVEASKLVEACRAKGIESDRLYQTSELILT
ncbi:MAG: MBL fold metallo-hydrolase [Vicinamibacterales bacterium]